MGKYSSHAQYLYGDIEVPSATTIISILNKPGLTKWANIMGFKRIRTEEVLFRAGTIGTAVHGCIESWLLNSDPFKLDKDMRMYEYEIVRRLDSFFTWANKQEFTPLHVEKKLVGPSFGGTVDFVGEFNGERYILDFKTSSKVHSSMFLQLAAYCHLLETEHNEIIDHVGIVHIQDDRTKLVSLSRVQLEEYIEIFVILSEVFHKWYNLNSRDWSNILEK